jgi:hypothetical protein
MLRRNSGVCSALGTGDRPRQMLGFSACGASGVYVATNELVLSSATSEHRGSCLRMKLEPIRNETVLLRLSRK